MCFIASPVCFAAVVEMVFVETAQRLVAYLFSLDEEDEELLALTVSALNSVAERSGPSVLAGLSSSRVRLVEEVRERMKNTSDEVGGAFALKFHNDIQGIVTSPDTGNQTTPANFNGNIISMTSGHVLYTPSPNKCMTLLNHRVNRHKLRHYTSFNFVSDCAVKA